MGCWRQASAGLLPSAAPPIRTAGRGGHPRHRVTQRDPALQRHVAQRRRNADRAALLPPLNQALGFAVDGSYRRPRRSKRRALIMGRGVCFPWRTGSGRAKVGRHAGRPGSAPYPAARVGSRAHGGRLNAARRRPDWRRFMRRRSLPPRRARRRWLREWQPWPRGRGRGLVPDGR